MGTRTRLILLCLALASLGIGYVRWRHTRAPDYLLTRGKEALQAEDTDRASSMVLELEARGFKEHAALLQGRIMMFLRRPAEALNHFNLVQSRTELQTEALASAGRCCLDLGNLIEAERAFHLVLKKDPEYLDAHRGLAALYYDIVSLSKALEHNQEWAKLDNKDGRPHRFSGIIQRDLKNYSEAIVHYENALTRELKPMVLEEVRMELADCYSMTQEFNKALELLDRNEPPPALAPQWLLLRAEALRGLGRADEAAEMVDLCLKANAKLTLASKLKGQLLLEQGDTEAAIRWLEQASRSQGKDFSTILLLSQAYASRGDAKTADRLLKECEDLRVVSKELSELTRVIMNNPRDATLYLHMAERYEKLDMPDLAARARRTAAIFGASPADLKKKN